MKIRILIGNDVTGISIREYDCHLTRLEQGALKIFNKDKNTIAIYNFNNIIGYEHVYD